MGVFLYFIHGVSGEAKQFGKNMEEHGQKAFGSPNRGDFASVKPRKSDHSSPSVLASKEECPLVGQFDSHPKLLLEP